MGKTRSWFSAVKKAIIRDSKESRQKKSRRSSGRCFGKQRSINMDSSNAESLAIVPANHSPPEQVKLIEAENEQNRHAYSVALVTAMAAEAAVAAANAAAEVVRLRAAAYNSGKTKDEVAAIKIQTAFRGYLARRVLKALRGLMRLRSVMEGKSVRRQATSTLKCMQTMARLQSEVRDRRIRMLEVISATNHQIQQKHEKELQKPRVSIGENWDESKQSKEQIEAKIQSRQEAAMRRERALAYAYSHQQTRSSSACADQTFMDPNNPHWGWSWLERWMAASATASTRPLENGNAEETTAPKRTRQSPSTPKSRSRIRPMSPRGATGTDEDTKSINSSQSDRCRKHSIAGSSVRDDDSFASSPALPGYMAATESARAKSRLPSPQGSENLGTPDRYPVKKRLSFSGSPSRPRRPPNTDAKQIHT